VSCEKPKEAKLVVSESEFVLNKLSEFSYCIDAKGKIKNIGEVDVKKVLVTGYCNSCFNGLNPGKWTISERERAPEEVDLINYICVGGEAEFSFSDVAVIYNTVPEPPKEIPEKLGISIVSFEVVD
jgi:hypothetical protein